MVYTYRCPINPHSPPFPAKVSSRPPSAAAQGRYNPASVYGQPLARKSKDVVRKSAGGEVRKSANEVRKSGGAKRLPSSGGDRAAANNVSFRVFGLNLLVILY